MGETDLMGVIKEYDTTISELTADYETEVVHYQKEQKELEELEEHFAKVDMENVRLEQEQQIMAARKSKLESKRRKEDEMATLVQSYWKAILDREAFTKEKKAKKKKQKNGVVQGAAPLLCLPAVLGYRVHLCVFGGRPWHAPLFPAT